MSEVCPAWPWPGARWWKFDLHTHTPISTDTSAWQQAKGTPDEVTCQQWLLAYMAAEIDCIAVTDHNSAGWVDALKAANAEMAKADPTPDGYRPITIFPGVEISVSGGLHILAIYDPGTAGSVITSLLGSVDFPARLQGETDSPDIPACTGKTIKDVIKEIRSAGGVIIPAHVDRHKGLLEASNQDALRHAIDLGVDAIELTDPSFTKPELYRSRNPGWAEVVGSDCHSFQGQAVPGSWYTWVKMAAPTIDGLRLALHDGNGVSIRRHDDPQAAAFQPFSTPDEVIASITIDGFQVMGNGTAVGLKCTPFFNAVIGGRGTGKSTVIHALRLAYNRGSELDALPKSSNARLTFERFNKVPKSRTDREGGGLRDASKVEVVLRRHDRWYLLTWTKDRQSVQEYDGTAWQASTSQTIDAQRFKVRLFSQGQIADLAGDNQQALLKIIDAGAGADSLFSAWEEAQRTYLAQMAQLRELDGRLSKREGIQLQLEDVQRKLTKLEGSDHAAILQLYQSTQNQQRSVDQQVDTASGHAASMRDLAAELVIAPSPPDIFDPAADADIAAVMQSVAAAVADAKEAVSSAAAVLESAIEAARQAPGTQAWSQRVAEAKQAYDQLQEELTAQGITDPGIYAQLVQQRQELQRQLADLDGVQTRRNALSEQAQDQLDAVYAARAAITEARTAFLSQHLADNPYVRISVIPGGEDIVGAETRLRETIESTDGKFAGDIYQNDVTNPEAAAVGMLATWAAAEDRRLAEQSVRDTLAQACIGSGSTGGHLRNNLNGKADRDPAIIDRIRCMSFEDGLKVETSRRGDGTDFRPIEQASAGQRSAAMLAFLLSYGDEPLVLDQPEDDLDNHMIYSLIVQQIRNNKLRRQLIVVTHNPNIVVNGDAELVHAFDFPKGQCVVRECGALQERSVREEVCHVMEGGPEAFRRRWQRLGESR